MLVLGALSLDVPGDRQIDMLRVVVPIKRDATEQSSLPVHCDFVVVFEGLLEVFGVLDALAFHTKSSTTKQNTMWQSGF